MYIYIYTYTYTHTHIYIYILYIYIHILPKNKPHNWKKACCYKSLEHGGIALRAFEISCEQVFVSACRMKMLISTSTTAASYARWIAVD